MIFPHWIPTHQGTFGPYNDKDVLAHWLSHAPVNGERFVKIISVDATVPYIEMVSESAKIIARNHSMSEEHGFAIAPAELARRHAETCNTTATWCEARGVPRSRLLFEGLNEPHLWADDLPAATAAYYAAFLRGLHGYGLHGVIGNFGVGWPGNGGVQDAAVDWAFFKPAIDTMITGDYLGLHEYWALQGPAQNWRWWGGRFLQCPYQVPILITECGIDTGVTGAWFGGWRDLPENTVDAQAQRYCDELWWYAGECAKDGRVQGITPFTYDIGSADWQKFNLRDEVFVRYFLERLDAVGLPKPGTVLPPVPPVIPPVVPPVNIEDTIRNAAWNALYPDGGIPFNPTAAFQKFGRFWVMGAPNTLECDVSGYRFQGFADGILYCPIGAWDNIKSMKW